MSSSAQPTKRRIRSESQLKQKRLADRIKHKENRQTSKKAMERIESDIALIKRGLQGLGFQLRALNSIPTPLPTLLSSGPRITLDQLHVPTWTGFPSPSQLPPDLLQPQAAAVVAGAPGNAAASLSSHGQGLIGPLGDLSQSTQQASHYHRSAPQTPVAVSRHVLDCQCGSRHLDKFDRIDHCAVTELYKGRTAPDHDADALGDMPRNPSLSAMTLQSTNDNTATFFITGFLRAYPQRSIEQLLASYFLGYRYMRWLMKPSPETLQDVPEWLRPTEIQQSHPHGVVVDYIPWPSLRDYLCSSGDTDPRHSLHVYFESVRLLWPPQLPLIARDPFGDFGLSPEFEAVTSRLESWAMGPPWTDAFPHLLHLVQP